MACIKGVVYAFLPFGKPGQPMGLSQGRKIRVTPCKQLMYIRLMANVKDQLILWAVQIPDLRPW